MTPEGMALLLTGAQTLNLNLTPEQQSLFEELYDLLVAGNARLNLTALRTEEDIVVKHFVDSLSCLQSGDLEGELKVLDLGTGGGFPALPLAIMRPKLHLVPMDATRKKINFVTETAATLRLAGVNPVSGRAETLGQQPEFRGQFDRVVARAVTALPILCELALPFLKTGGKLIAQKGDLTDQELQAGRRAALELGGQVSGVMRFPLPVQGDQRTLITVEQNRPAPHKYPRRDGLPNQQPLFWKARG